MRSWTDAMTDENTKRMEAAKRCRGQYSIQNEINKIAKGEGATWGKLIQDKKWREETRQKLLQTQAEWCDYKTSSCACEKDFLSTAAKFDRSIL